MTNSKKMDFLFGFKIIFFGLILLTFSCSDTGKWEMLDNEYSEAEHLPIPIPIPSDIIIDMVVNDSANTASWSILANIQVGDHSFGDSSYTISTLPSIYTNSDWIRTACDSMVYTGDPLVIFTVTQDATVYIMHDDRAAVIPCWLFLWTDTTDNLFDSESVSCSIYSKFFTADSLVLLGNNGDTSGCNDYSIIVK